jgi:hypothetical protein
MINRKRTRAILCLSIFLLAIILSGIGSTSRVMAARSITFPVIGKASYSNDYNEIHNGVTHHAIDILAKKGSVLVAAVSGTITDVQYPEPSWGYSVTIRDSAGYKYTYLHMNDDHPGTNDGNGGAMNAYARDIQEGNPVVKGQRIGAVGDSGNSNGVSHLHFEMRTPDNKVTNPYTSLQNAKHISSPATAPAMASESLPFGVATKVNANVASGNLSPDSGAEYVVASKSGIRTQVKAYTHDKVQLGGTFYPYGAATYGTDVALGDVDGDGVDEVITAAGKGGHSLVRMFEMNGTKIGEFYAYGSTFSDGTRVASADIDGDGYDEIITAPGGNEIGPLVRVFELNGTKIGEFYAYNPSFKSGFDVGAGDVTGTTTAEIVTTPNAGAPRVSIFQPDGTKLTDFITFSSSYLDGIHVSVGDAVTSSAKEEIMVVPLSDWKPKIKIYDFGGTLLRDSYFIEQWWNDASYDVAGDGATAIVSAGGNRRTTVRWPLGY